MIKQVEGKKGRHARKKKAIIGWSREKKDSFRKNKMQPARKKRSWCGWGKKRPAEGEKGNIRKQKK